ncbi:alpha/beta hydrolase [Gimesia panareensis]|uniref:alpha/beta hydrolase n=1 Tax=Gimesia panareensis TaxID=2527978 RepID=UPI00118D35A6|nr:alpha/beta hydrolase [Gimesia panareensis]QDU50165.1 Carboxylesterase NlhH [Gimesia panareensis]
MRPSYRAGLLLVLLLISAPTRSFAVESIQRINDIQYATTDQQRLLLDLYLPEGVKQPPLLVWIHGGAWRAGSKANMPLTELVEHGFAVASVEYRLSPVARFPAQIHDIKAAIRFLRGSADKYGYNADKIGILGSSAGGHLVALMGVTNGNAQLEGDLGDFDQESSRIDAIVDYYGPTNFMTILPQSTPHGLSVRVPALQLLLGDRPENKPELAKLASPVFHVDDKDPPLLMIHGDQDPQVPINQSHELHGKYKQQGLDVTFEVIHGGAHGGPQFFDAKRMQLVEAFLRKHLISQPAPKQKALQSN